MTWFTIIILLLLGLLFVVLELIFVPGTTFVGIIGVILTITGVFFAFQDFGTSAGWLAIGITLLANVIAIVVALRSGTWEKMGLKGTSTSRVNEDIVYDLQKGDIGKAISAMRPSGTVEFKDQLFEASTFGEYVKAGQQVRIIEIQGKTIYVETLDKYQTNA
jgi:membrane-bound ClpP family serine protease